MATSIAIQQEALSRARSSQSIGNFAKIIEGFIRKGIPADQISPRENVFTYNAWKALGRQVRKGEHGVRCLTFIVTKDRAGRESKRPWSTTVFHISQTDKLGTEYVRIPTPVPSTWNREEKAAYLDLDATPENIPYAGEEETDVDELLEHSAAVHADRTPEPEPTWEERVQKLEDEGLTRSDAQAVVDAEDQRKTPEVIPAPAPKDSASVRAMRGEQVSIMDMIDEFKREPARLPRRLQSSQPFQTKTVDF